MGVLGGGSCSLVVVIVVDMYPSTPGKEEGSWVSSEDGGRVEGRFVVVGYCPDDFSIHARICLEGVASSFSTVFPVFSVSAVSIGAPAVSDTVLRITEFPEGVLMVVREPTEGTVASSTAKLPVLASRLLSFSSARSLQAEQTVDSAP